MEISFIKEFNSIQIGLNCREGGKAGFKNSPETLEKIRIKNIGRKHTIEAKNKISIGNSGNKHCLGRVLSDNTKMKMSNSHKGQHENSKRRVRAVSKEGEVFDFDSITDATIFVDRTVNSATNICAALKGRLKTAFGYKWNYI